MPKTSFSSISSNGCCKSNVPSEVQALDEGDIVIFTDACCEGMTTNGHAGLAGSFVTKGECNSVLCPLASLDVKP